MFGFIRPSGNPTHIDRFKKLAELLQYLTRLLRSPALVPSKYLAISARRVPPSAGWTKTLVIRKFTRMRRNSRATPLINVFSGQKCRTIRRRIRKRTPRAGGGSERWSGPCLDISVRLILYFISTVLTFGYANK